MITSRSNKKIKEAVKLQKKSYRKQRGQYLIEGSKLFQEALENKAQIEAVFTTEDFLTTHSEVLNTVEYEEVSESVMEKLSSLKNPEGLVAIVKMNKNNSILNDNSIYLDNINDPGNLGTIIRTADAVGIKQVILSENCVDPYNIKVIRASMGSIFRIELLIESPEYLEELKNLGYLLIGASIKGQEINIRDLEIPKQFILIFGSESHGIDQQIEKICNQLVRLPLKGKAESLNVAVAAGILMYAYTAE